jgi:DNA-binding HxlR family transcriptional regulator
MPPDVLRDSVSALRNKGMVEVAASSDPLRPSVKITEKGLDQLSFLI